MESQPPGVEEKVVRARRTPERGFVEQRPAPRATPQVTPVERMLALQKEAGNGALARVVQEERRERSTSYGQGLPVQRSVYDVLRTPGHPLDPPFYTETRNRFEGESPSRVRSPGEAADRRSAERANERSRHERGGADGLAPAPQVGPVVQRKVGFEFEDSAWRSWRRLRQDHGRVGDVLRRARNVLPALDDDLVTPATRKTVLHRGNGFNLESDARPDPVEADLEFVTEPFDETAEGLAALRRTVAEIKTIMRRLDGLTGKPGPVTEGGAPPYPLTAKDYKERFVRHEQHQLNGSSGLASKDVLLSDGKPGGLIKMQYTSGVPLADLPRMMEELGRSVPEETEEQTEQRRPDRALIYPEDLRNETLSVQGQAPSLARQVVESLRGEGTYAMVLGDDTAALTGFLAATILAMKLLQRPGGRTDPVKYRLPLMHRTHFADMFKGLTDEQQKVIGEHPDVMLEHLLRVSNTHPLMMHNRDAGLSAHTPLLAPRPGPLRRTEGGVVRGTPSSADSALASLTIGAWIKGITTGVDYLTPEGIQQWFSGTDDVSEEDKNAAVSALRSVGTERSLDTREGRSELAVFENRSVAPTGPGGLITIDQAADQAVQFLQYFRRLREQSRGRRP